MDEMIKGRGTGRRNKVEREAYEFVDRVKITSISTTCPESATDYHGGCNSIHSARSNEYNAAAHWYCNKKGFGTDFIHEA